MVGPLAVVYQPGRQGVEVKVHQAVGADDHGGLGLVELVNNPLQRVGAAVEVVAVQLHGKQAAVLRAHGEVPASADAQVVVLRDEVDNFTLSTRILFPDFFNRSSGAVGGVVVHHNHIEGEVRHLAQRRAYGIADGALSVAHGDNHAGGGLAAWAEVGIANHVGSQQTSNVGEVSGESLLHLHLHLAHGGVDIVKLLCSALAQVALLLGIEIFGQVDFYARTYLILVAELVIVEGSIPVVGAHHRAGVELHAAEVEVVAHPAQLAVYQGMGHGLAVPYLVMVGIHHLHPVAAGADHAADGAVAHLERRGLGIYKVVVGLVGVDSVNHLAGEECVGHFLYHHELVLLVVNLLPGVQARGLQHHNLVQPLLLAQALQRLERVRAPFVK